MFNSLCIVYPQGEDSNVIQGWKETVHSAWTYQSALKRISETMDAEDENQPKRTPIASLIAAARRNIQKSLPKKADTLTIITQQETLDSEEEKDDSSSDHSDIHDDVSDQEEDNGVVQSMAQDNVRERLSNPLLKQTIEKSDDHTSGQNEADNESVDDEADSLNSTNENVVKERERREEAVKAAKFFDSTENTTYEEDPNRDLLFSQLNISRPLLRGVAAMGFVKPTPIQVQCIPAVLAGRDVCARYDHYLHHLRFVHSLP